MDMRLMEKMAELSVVNVPIILDLGQFDEQIFQPVLEHNLTDLPSQVQHKTYIAALFLADLITVPSESFADKLRSYGYPAQAIPNGWSITNPYWTEKPERSGATIQLGWFGSSENIDDLAVIRRPLIRLLSEFDDKLRIIIVGNQNAYRMFDHVPEELKTFIPYLAKDELPYIINQMDILLMPLRKTPENNLCADDMLVYAGLKKIPWAASSFPALTNWGKGGMTCTSLEEWHTNLRCLILDKDLRQALGSDGFHNAAWREMFIHIQLWYQAFNQAQSLRYKKMPTQ
jgi:hypothetical protein